MDTLLPTQPQGYWSLIRYSFRLYAASFPHVILIAFLLALLSYIPRFLFDLYGIDYFAGIPLYSPVRLWLTVLNLIIFILLIAIFWNMHCLDRGVRESLIEDMSKGVRKVLYVFIATLLANLIIFLIAMLAIKCGIYLHAHHLLFTNGGWGMILSSLLILGVAFLILYATCLFLFLLPIIAIEDKGIISAIKRSCLVVWDHWWRVLKLQITPWFTFFILLMIFRYIINTNTHSPIIENLPQPLWVTVSKMSIFAFFIPWICALILVQLRDLELRKEITQQDQHAV